MLAVSFARIHRANLINFGIVPIEISAEDYDRCQQGDELRIEDVRGGLQSGGQLLIDNATKGSSFTGSCQLAERPVEVLLAGGALNWAQQELRS